MDLVLYMKGEVIMQKRFSQIFGVISAVLFLAFGGYLLSTTGFMGLIRWEKSYRMYFIILVLVGLLGLLLALFQRGKVLKAASTILSAVLLVVAVGGSIFVYSLGTWKLEREIELNFYTSADGPLSNTKEVAVAIGSDAHWGASTSNGEARNRILDVVNEGPWDLFVFGGDMVEFGFAKSHTEAAICDMEEHLDKVPVHFAIGNHDVLVNTENNYRRFFKPGETSSNYVLEIAPGVHWVMFELLWDMSDVSKKDLKWLEETLNSFDKEDIVIVQSHGFYYGSGSISEGGGDWYDIPDVIKEIVPIFEKHHVDLVLSGHQHSMELLEKNGIHYALVGPMGGSLYKDYTFETEAEQLYYNGYDYGFTTVDIKDETIKLTFRNENGENLFDAEW